MNRTLALALLLSLPALLAAQSSSGCTSADFSGTYVALGEGTVLLQPPPLPDNVLGPLVRVGRVVAQDGNITFTYTVGVYHGVVYEHTFAGIYTVSSDCRLDLLFPQGPTPLYPLPLPFTGTIADNGKSARVSSVTPGTVATATLTKITGQGCSQAAVKGTYLLDMSGFSLNWPLPWPAEAPSRNGVFARVGKLILDGSGTFQGTAMANYNGVLEFETFTGGTYTVDNECKLKLTATVTEAAPTADQLLYPNLPGAVAGPSYSLTLQGVMTDHTTAYLIQSDPAGVAVNGRLVQSNPVKSPSVGFVPAIRP